MSDPDRPPAMEGRSPAGHSTPLRNRIEGDARAVDVSAAVVTIWREVDAAMRPIIGQRGVVALFNRSVKLTAAAHPWLMSGRQDLDRELQFPAIADIFSKQETAAAMAGGDALLLAFHQLLSSLIGASLTERLLGPAYRPTTGASSTQDSSS